MMTALLTTILIPMIIYGITGVCAGIIAGALGVGGGMIIVPALLYIFHYNNIIPPIDEMHFAAGTSLAIMILTAEASVRAHYRKKTILWSAYHRLQAGIIVGTILGSLLASQVPTYWLKIILGLVLLFIATEMSFNPDLPQRKNFPPAWVNRLMGTLIGFKSGLLGIGGGALIIPYLSYCGVHRRQTAPVSAVCTLTVSIIGTIAFIITGLCNGTTLEWSTGYVYWPAVLLIGVPSMLCAPIGARLTYILPVHQLKRAFIVILIIAAIDLLR